MPTSDNSQVVATPSQGVGLSAPGFDPTKKIPTTPPVRAIRDVTQAAQVCVKLIEDAKDRIRKGKRIMSKYNAERPFDQTALQQDGLGWKTNISTQPLASMVDRIAPRFERALESVKYLTSSALPENVPGAAKKTDEFRREITALCRSREGWDEFVGDVAQENALFGFTAAACVDEYCWFPTHFRQDRFFVQPNTKQHSDSAEVVLLLEEWQPHELVAILRDRKTAEDAGWFFEDTVQAVNDAMPISLRSGNSDSTRIYEDLQREANLAVGFNDGARVVQVYSLYVRESTGKISHWRISNTSGTSSYRLLFRRYDRYDSFHEFVTFFAFQRANGTLQGSKGVGRIVYDMAGVIDRTRNEVIDRLQLAGKLLMTGDDKNLQRFRMSVFGNAILVSSEFDISQKSIEPRTDEFFKLDQFLNQILNEQSGNVTPRQFEGERTTKAEVDVFVAREEESKDTPIARFLKQFAKLVSMIQKRAMDPKCDEPDAKAARKRLLKLMSEDELKQLAETPSANVVKDLSDMERQQVILAATELQGNPFVNQEELTRRKLTAQLGSDFAEAVMVPANDPTVSAEQTRTQMMENALLTLGQDVPVSPRDSHPVHLEVLMPAIDMTLQAANADATAGEIIKKLLAHGAEHLRQAIAAGVDKSTLSEYQNKLTKTAEIVAQLDAHDQAVADAVEQGLPPEQASLAGQQAAAAVVGGPTEAGAPAAPMQ